MTLALSDEEIDLRLLLEAIFLKYQYDFRDYALSSIKRRMAQALAKLGGETITSLQDRVVHDSEFFQKLLTFLTVPVTEMFRDPEFFLAVRREVLPSLQTYPSIKLWVAGCSTGEEVYSYAILLQEADLLDSSLIYATDIQPESLTHAKAGVYAREALLKYEVSYREAGGQKDFLKTYFTCNDDQAIVLAELKKNILFSDHSLATDSVFAEVQFASCRNVLIYFNRSLQDRALGLFYESLSHRGYLALGNKESLNFSNYADRIETINRTQRIFRKLP